MKPGRVRQQPGLNNATEAQAGVGPSGYGGHQPTLVNGEGSCQVLPAAAAVPRTGTASCGYHSSDVGARGAHAVLPMATPATAIGASVLASTKGTVVEQLLQVSRIRCCKEVGA